MEWCPCGPTAGGGFTTHSEFHYGDMRKRASSGFLAELLEKEKRAVKELHDLINFQHHEMHQLTTRIKEAEGNQSLSVRKIE
jgi:hypothetical protein